MSTPPPPSDGTRYLGVDLAWGERNRTGLAVLDASGRLTASTSVRTDDDITAFVTAHSGDTVVAAVDAPLVVPNETGRRWCEAEVGRLFGHSHAGAYPANRGNPAFSPQPRGARLAARLGWDLDPAVRPADGRKTCVEVYPHPAMVVLFGLDRVIPYKAKPGRTLADLADAHRRLLGHLETTCGPVLRLHESARWRHLRSVVAAPRRKSELEAVEDEVDAIFCAYLAWLWATEPDRLLVLGDVQTGYIVTPAPGGAGTGGAPQWGMSDSPQPAVRATAIHHVRLTVTDIVRSRDFYRRALGVEPAFDFSDQASDPTARTDPHRFFGGTTFAVGGQLLGLRPVAVAGDRFDSTRVGLDHVSLAVGSVDDLHTAAERLTAMGVEHGEVTELAALGIAILSLQDPDGINLELVAALG